MTVDLITDFESLCQLQPEWASLVKSLTIYSPFQTTQWLLTWWRHFGSGVLHTLAFREGDRLVGLLPMFRHQWNDREQLTLIGSGISDYLDPPLLPEFAGQIISVLAHELSSNRSWDVCNWQDLSNATPLQSVSTASTLSVDKQADTVCSAISLPADFETYWRERSADHRRNIARHSRKAEAQGAVEFHVEDSADHRLLDALIELHGARWRNRGEAGTIAANRSAAFLRDVGEQLSDIGALRLFSLVWRSKIVAVIFGMAQADVLYGYLSGFNPEWEDLGFGRHLLFQSLRYAANNGYHCWNFLRGNEPYKASWGAVPIHRCRLVITRS